MHTSVRSGSTVYCIHQYEVVLLFIAYISTKWVYCLLHTSERSGSTVYCIHQYEVVYCLLHTSVRSGSTVYCIHQYEVVLLFIAYISTKWVYY